MSGIIRVYKRDDEGILQFREAWYDEVTEQVVVNFGTVGHQSKTEETDVESTEAADALLTAFAAQCEADDFVDVPLEEQFWAVAQYSLKSPTGTDRDKYLQDKAERTIIEYFAWRGIGIVDRTEMSNGKLNIFCIVPDATRAVQGLKVCLREANLDFTKLSIGVAPYNDIENIKAKHLPAAAKTFSLG
ncbi:hypothetical protein ACQR35_11625 [Pseudarthrobacter sp. J1738]|uniref:hypothetical protein n=1 Tax=unclassified Pseudarthrobacter TaxID=2647000 RepID=UPI003D2E2F79